jgi:hypothetical protein
VGGAHQDKEEKQALLFEKRSKNFCYHRRALPKRVRLIIKSFLVLFFKKELLSLIIKTIH